MLLTCIPNLENLSYANGRLTETNRTDREINTWTIVMSTYSTTQFNHL